MSEYLVESPGTLMNQMKKSTVDKGIDSVESLRRVRFYGLRQFSM
jgi:hypothetical protein